MEQESDHLEKKEESGEEKEKSMKRCHIRKFEMENNILKKHDKMSKGKSEKDKEKGESQTGEGSPKKEQESWGGRRKIKVQKKKGIPGSKDQKPIEKTFANE